MWVYGNCILSAIPVDLLLMKNGCDYEEWFSNQITIITSDDDYEMWHRISIYSGQEQTFLSNKEETVS